MPTENVDNIQSKEELTLETAKKEVQELIDDVHDDHDAIENLSDLLATEFENFLSKEENTAVANDLYDKCLYYKQQIKNWEDADFDALFDMLQRVYDKNEIVQEWIEYHWEKINLIESNDITVYLRWKYDVKKHPEVDIDLVRKNISDKINTYIDARDYLPDEAKNVLSLTKSALSSISDTTNDDKSFEVWQLERALGMPGTPSSELIHDWVDWKFWDKTFNALTTYLENIQLKKIESFNEWNIQATLRWKWSIESWEANNNGHPTYEAFVEDGKKEMEAVIDKYVWDRENLSFDQQRILILTKAALETKSHLDENGWPVSEEVKYLETALNMPNTPSSEIIHDSVDWKFWDKTFEALKKYLAWAQKPIWGWTWM